MVAPDGEKSRLDEAARAGWLYFIAGHTQDEIAKMLTAVFHYADFHLGMSLDGLLVELK